jgi:hypothetical protein
MHQFALKDEGHCFETPMRMRPERQTTIVWRIYLRPVMIQEEKRIHLRNARPRERATCDEIRNVVAI